ncbi:DNA topoisomerase 1 [Vanrija albida]|uniref:DNA topoisomerase I n=1 Tax=Vanrija albida TaxID=181172 RepID=A0ABR3Q650_9TREE
MSAPNSTTVEAPTFTSTGGAPDKRPAANGQSSDDEDDVPLSRAKPVTNGKRAGAAASSDEDERPLSKKPRVSSAPSKKRRIVESDDDESDAGPSSPVEPKTNGSSKPARPADSDSEDEKPLAQKRAAPRSSNGSSKPPSKRAAAQKPPVNDDSSEEEEKPLAKGRKPTSASKPAAKPAAARRSSGAASKVKAEPESSEDDKPLAKKAAKGKAAPAKTAVKKEAVKKEKKPKTEGDDEEDGTYKWWEQGEGDGSSKWTTLVHNGVLFPPPYVPLPKSVRMKYDGVPLTLPPESEEVAGFFGAMLETDHAKDKTFIENFFKDFKAVVAQYPPKENVKVTKFEKCDFRPMYDHFEEEREKKKSMTKDEKKAAKDAKDKLEEPYLYALVDGRKEKLGNFRAEPPGLFRGRGEHPKKGTWKHRLRPEDIIINIGKDAPVPIPNVPGKWKGIQHDNTVTWLAHWKENVNGQSKYVFLSAASSWKGQSDRSKFEKARELIKHVGRIRSDYTVDLKSKVMADRQRATALYFVDRLALRAGNEKGEDEADTVGCCSLRYEHVTLKPPSTVVFDFLGKDSMRFHQEVEVDAQVFKNIKIFKAEPKKTGDDLFDRLNTTLLNRYLQEQMKGLTAKVFRTYNASWTFQEQLKNTPRNGTVAEKIAAYNTANRDVAILCNHQKTVSKGFEESKAKAEDKIRAVKYQRMKLRLQLFTLNPKAKKKHPELAEDESDMDDDFIERHEVSLKEKAIDTATKKFEKDNLKLKEQKEKPKPQSELKERIKEIEVEFKELAKERKSRKVEPKGNATEEKLLEQISKVDERIATQKVQLGDRDKLKDVALGTSKINYIDPRLTVAWAKKYEVPLEKLFSKTLREKFPWAEAEADEDWIF